MFKENPTPSPVIPKEEKITLPSLEASPLGKILGTALATINTIQEKYHFDQKPSKEISPEEAHARKFFDLIQQIFTIINNILLRLDNREIPSFFDRGVIAVNLFSLKSLLKNNLLDITHPSQFELAWALIPLIDSDSLPKQLTELIPFLNPQALVCDIGGLFIIELDKKEYKTDQALENIYAYKIDQKPVNLSKKYSKLLDSRAIDIFLKLDVLSQVGIYFQAHFKTPFVKSKIAEFQLLARFKENEESRNGLKLSNFCGKMYEFVAGIQPTTNADAQTHQHAKNKDPADIQKQLENIKIKEEKITSLFAEHQDLQGELERLETSYAKSSVRDLFAGDEAIFVEFKKAEESLLDVTYADSPFPENIIRIYSEGEEILNVTKEYGFKKSIFFYKERLKAAKQSLEDAKRELKQREKGLLVQWHDETVNAHRLKAQQYRNELQTIQSEYNEQIRRYAPLAKQAFENVDLEIKELTQAIEQLNQVKQAFEQRLPHLEKEFKEGQQLPPFPACIDAQTQSQTLAVVNEVYAKKHFAKDRSEVTLAKENCAFQITALSEQLKRAQTKKKFADSMRSCDPGMIESNLENKKQEEQKLIEKITGQKAKILDLKIISLTKEEQKALYEHDIKEDETRQQSFVQQKQELLAEVNFILSGLSKDKVEAKKTAESKKDEVVCKLSPIEFDQDEEEVFNVFTVVEMEEEKVDLTENEEKNEEEKECNGGKTRDKHVLPMQDQQLQAPRMIEEKHKVNLSAQAVEVIANLYKQLQAMRQHVQIKTNPERKQLLLMIGLLEQSLEEFFTDDNIKRAKVDATVFLNFQKQFLALLHSHDDVMAKDKSWKYYAINCALLLSVVGVVIFGICSKAVTGRCSFFYAGETPEQKQVKAIDISVRTTLAKSLILIL